jgi:hypothetical protein
VLFSFPPHRLSSTSSIPPKKAFLVTRLAYYLCFWVPIFMLSAFFFLQFGFISYIEWLGIDGCVQNEMLESGSTANLTHAPIPWHCCLKWMGVTPHLYHCSNHRGKDRDPNVIFYQIFCYGSTWNLNLANCNQTLESCHPLIWFILCWPDVKWASAAIYYDHKENLKDT